MTKMQQSQDIESVLKKNTGWTSGMEHGAIHKILPGRARACGIV